MFAQSLCVIKLHPDPARALNAKEGLHLLFKLKGSVVPAEPCLPTVCLGRTAVHQFLILQALDEAVLFSMPSVILAILLIVFQQHAEDEFTSTNITAQP